MPPFCFAAIEEDQVTTWTGDPDCQTAHNALLEFLRTTPGAFNSNATLNTRLKGNLGEFITYFVGNGTKFGEAHSMVANALAPLSNISRTDIDILWLILPESEDGNNDCAILQEVKTTAAEDLGYAATVIDDYEKLFGIDLNLTLHSRLAFAALKLRQEQRRSDLAARVEKLGGPSPRVVKGIRLVPTLVHDRNVGDPRATMSAIRTSLVGSQHWSPSIVDSWAIGLDNLEQRLQRLLVGQQ